MDNFNCAKTSPHISFGARCPVGYKDAERVVRNIRSNGWISSTAIKDLMFLTTKPHEKGASNLFHLKDAEQNLLGMKSRRLIKVMLKFSDKDDFITQTRKLTSKIRNLNCSEYAYFAYQDLTKMGYKCRVISDEHIDHSFVVMNCDKKITGYSNKHKGELVVDAWTGNVYRSLQEAFLDFKRRFDADYKTQLFDVTESRPDGVTYQQCGPLAKLYNKINMMLLCNLLKRIKTVAHEVATTRLRNRNKASLKEKLDDKTYMYYFGFLEGRIKSRAEVLSFWSDYFKRLLFQ